MLDAYPHYLIVNTRYVIVEHDCLVRAPQYLLLECHGLCLELPGRTVSRSLQLQLGGLRSLVARGMMIMVVVWWDGA